MKELFPPWRFVGAEADQGLFFHLFFVLAGVGASGIPKICQSSAFGGVRHWWGEKPHNHAGLFARALRPQSDAESLLKHVQRRTSDAKGLNNNLVGLYDIASRYATLSTLFRGRSSPAAPDSVEAKCERGYRDVAAAFEAAPSYDELASHWMRAARMPWLLGGHRPVLFDFCNRTE